jgi:hypothetical protein
MSNSTSCPDRLAWLVPTYDDVQYDAPITDSPAYVVVQVAPAAAAAFAWGLVEAARSRARARGPVRCAASLALLGVLATSPVAWRFVEVLGCEWDAAERTNTVWCGIAVVAHGALAVLLFATAVRWARRGLVLGLAVASGAAVGGVGLHGWWLDAPRAASHLVALQQTWSTQLVVHLLLLPAKARTPACATPATTKVSVVSVDALAHRPAP